MLQIRCHEYLSLPLFRYLFITTFLHVESYLPAPVSEPSILPQIVLSSLVSLSVDFAFLILQPFSELFYLPLSRFEDGKL